MSIDKHEWFDMYQPEVLSANETAVVLGSKEHAWIAIGKKDAIALAKHFNLNAHDIDCSEFKALQDDSDTIDEAHFDECVELRTQVAELNRKLTMKGVN